MMKKFGVYQSVFWLIFIECLCKMPFPIYTLSHLIFPASQRYFYNLHFTYEDIEAREIKKFVRGHTVAELGLEPRCLSLEPVP